MKGTVTNSIAIRMTVSEAQKLVTDILLCISGYIKDEIEYMHGAELTVSLYNGDPNNASITAYPVTWPKEVVT